MFNGYERLMALIAHLQITKVMQRSLKTPVT